MKTFQFITCLIILLCFASCSKEISQKNVLNERQLAFMKGEKKYPSSKKSYIMNGKKYHPFLFSEQLEIVKDKSIDIKAKSKLVYQSIHNHIEMNGFSIEDQADMQRIILYLYGDYSNIDETIAIIPLDQNEFFLKVLVDYKAIDFKYLAKISKFIDSKDTYVLPMSREYLEKYERIIVERHLDTTTGYGAHCANIIKSCEIAIKLLQDS